MRCHKKKLHFVWKRLNQNKGFCSQGAFVFVLIYPFEYSPPTTKNACMRQKNKRDCLFDFPRQKKKSDRTQKKSLTNTLVRVIGVTSLPHISFRPSTRTHSPLFFRVWGLIYTVHEVYKFCIT
eukprot:GEMP01124043.1.p1 GENE.GEMP01124043.1~~GEMP01124043.1.p1  ORF type:complete len:123 (+),score=7.71 GEMP01124043.1:108-476(+)